MRRRVGGQNPGLPIPTLEERDRIATAPEDILHEPEAA